MLMHDRTSRFDCWSSVCVTGVSHQLAKGWFLEGHDVWSHLCLQWGRLLSPSNSPSERSIDHSKLDHIVCSYICTLSVVETISFDVRFPSPWERNTTIAVKLPPSFSARLHLGLARYSKAHAHPPRTRACREQGAHSEGRKCLFFRVIMHYISASAKMRRGIDQQQYRRLQRRTTQTRPHPDPVPLFSPVYATHRILAGCSLPGSSTLGSTRNRRNAATLGRRSPSPRSSAADET